MDFAWCKHPDIGLPKPDRVFYLDVDEETAKKRANFGEERYEKAEFQRKVYAQFKKFEGDDFWTSIDSARDMDEITGEITGTVKKLVENGVTSEVGKLWVEDVQNGGNGGGHDKSL